MKRETLFTQNKAINETLPIYKNLLRVEIGNLLVCQMKINKWYAV